MYCSKSVLIPIFKCTYFKQFALMFSKLLYKALFVADSVNQLESRQIKY